jgi:ATP-binding cassette, subfamily C, bacterial LapB
MSLTTHNGAANQVSNAAAGGMALAAALQTTVRQQGGNLDRLRLHDAISRHHEQLSTTDETNWPQLLKDVALAAGIEDVVFQPTPDAARLPALAWLPELGWVTVRTRTPTGDWLLDHQGKTFTHSSAVDMMVARLVLPAPEPVGSQQPVRQLFRRAFLSHRKVFIEGALAGVLINLLALATSLYSMQVYDRVIPTQGYATLFVLTLGVMISMAFEFILKIIRSHLIEHASVDIDGQLSRAIFGRLLQIRLDRLPASVGSLSAQIRGYETVRTYLSSGTFYALVDAPFGLIFVLLIGLIGGFEVATVPLIFLLISLGLGIYLRNRFDQHARLATAAANLKTGLLVEAIEGAETLKAGGGGWGALSRWIEVVDEGTRHELASRSLNEKGGYFSALLQSASYVGLVAAGAYFTAEGHLTMGALIACSILSGRALGPMAQLPSLMTQRAMAKAALEGLEKVYALEMDNHDVERPLLPERLHGHYQLERVRFAYPGSPQALSVAQLHIKPGEKVGVIGPIGSGKSTLLRLLTGMYQASEGRILLDSLDIDQISRPVLSDRIGYLQQEHRLFSGTLRQNLLVGIPDPGDEALRNAAAMTGLLGAITHHPKGLDMQIAEGGKGLSGGQRQLVALTRLLLSRPNIWLLDEPTAAMDDQTEQRCLQVLRQAVQPESTMVLVTHKPTLLPMVNRLIVVSNHQVLMDGPRDQVIAQLNENAQRQQEAARAAMPA